MPDLSSLGRTLLLLGAGVTLVGGVLWALGRSGVPLGRLPGDFRFDIGGATCFVPLATSILLSLGLTLLLNLVVRFLNK